MDMFSHLALGFGEALTGINLLYCLVGILLGTLVGVLPGLGPVPTMAMLLPVTFGLPPTTGLIMLAGIFYGSQYGGSTSAILLRLPGEVSSIVTALDGYKMARSGRAGSALTVSALGSFFGGCMATFFLAALAVPLSSLALKFGPADYVSLMALGLVGAVALSSDSTLKAVGLVLVGMLLGLIGTDLTSGLVRYTFDIGFLSDGIDFVVIAMGLFGIASVISSLAEVASAPTDVPKIGRLRMTREEVKASVPAILRGTVMGSVLGILPGGGVVLSSFMSYLVEKRLSSTPERFGEGAIEGVAGPESANNAASQTTFVPLLILGLPTNAVAALMGGAMMVHNIVPGPEVISSNPSLFWGLIASMWIGNAMLLFLNLPLIGLWVRLVSMPYKYIFPAIILFCCIGVYATSYQPGNVVLLMLFGLFGYVLYLLNCQPAPLLMGMVLAPLLEEQFKRAMLMSRGSPMTFLDSPISAFFIALIVIVLLVSALPRVTSWRRTHIVE
jgi:putative tricarboxylic transport membrane protein